MTTKQWKKIAHQATSLKIDKCLVSENHLSVWKITHDNSPQILRIYNLKNVETQHMDCTWSLLTQLKSIKGYNGTLPLQKLEIGSQFRGFRLTYIEGKHPRVNSNLQLISAGRAIAHFHKLTSKIEIGGMRRYNYKSITNNINEPIFLAYLSSSQKQEIEKICFLIKENIKEVENSSSLCGILHGDPHWENIITNPDGVFLIDFDDCGYGLYMYDLAVGIADTMQENPKQSKRIKECFVKGYLEVFPQKEKLIEKHLNHLIKLRYIDYMLRPFNEWSEKEIKEYSDEIIEVIEESMQLLN
ncbi:MAG: phosphotransferase enzyme family protein [Thermonemataceae bacterium]